MARTPDHTSEPRSQIHGEISKKTITPPQRKDISLVLVGDIMLARGVSELSRQRNEQWPFDDIFGLINEADVAVGNLESLVGVESTSCVDCFRFTVRPPEIQILHEVGFDLLAIANNHAHDYADGPKMTQVELQKLGLGAIGFVPGENNMQTPLIREIDGYQIGFLAYTDLTNTNFQQVAQAKVDQIKNDLAALSELVDFVIVNFHWGQEYTHQPTERQVALAHGAIEAGADLIIGHHAHWVQAIEIYQDGAIFYGLGNCVFNMMHTIPTRQGIAVKLMIDRFGERVYYQVVPLILEDYARPRVIRESEVYYREILAVIKSVSAETISLPRFSLSLPELVGL